MTRLQTIFTQALERLSAGDFPAMEHVLGEDYKQAYAQAGDDAARAAARHLHAQLHLAAHPAARTHIATCARQAREALEGEGGMAAAASLLHDALHQIDHQRQHQAADFTAREAALYEEKGALGYAAGLARRRWAAPEEGAGAPGASAHHDHAAHAHDPAHNACHHGHDPDHGAHHAPAASPVDALEEYGGIRRVATAGRKLAVGAGASVGLGLVVHGGMNMMQAFSAPEEDRLRIRPPAQQEQGVNWTRLAVGTAEMAAGAALAYRMLTGRWGLRGPLKGVADPLLECSHGHHH